MKRIQYLDALRGWAILLVIAFHVSYPIGGHILSLMREGDQGVSLFYVVSGLTIFHSLHRKQEAHWIRNFFIRRLFRIAPLFYAVLGVYLFRDQVWNFGNAVPHSLSASHILTDVAFLNGFFPHYINSILHVEWSIAIEMLFYLLVPLIFVTIRSTKQALGVTLGCALAGLMISKRLDSYAVIPSHDLWHQYLSFWLPNHLFVFCLGIALYFITSKPLDRKYAWPLLILGLGMLAVIYMQMTFHGGKQHRLYVLAFVPLVWGLHLHESRLLVNRFTVYLGKISFSCYLLHSAVWPVVYGHFIQGMAGTDTVRYLAFLAGTLGATMALSALTYRLIEVNGIGLGNKLIKRLDRENGSTSAATPQPQ